MQKIITSFLSCFILTNMYAQAQKKVCTYLLADYNKTIYDVTSGNNPSAVGLALQAFVNSNSKFKPAIELTGDIYLEDDKVGRLTPSGKQITDVGSMVNFFVGSSYDLTQNIYLSFLAGPSFISGKTLPGIKPSFGFFFSKNKKWQGKVSYINIFNRYQPTKEDFGSVSFSVGLKLF